MHDIGKFIESGSHVIVLTHGNNGNHQKRMHGRVVSVMGKAARVRVEGEQHPRTIRFNMLELVEEKATPTSITTTAVTRKVITAQHVAPPVQQTVVVTPAKPVQSTAVQPPQAIKTQQAQQPPRMSTAGGVVWIIPELTPEMAEKFLANQHTGQRNLRENHVYGIAKAMEVGDYRWTGDPIRFDKGGRLIDGQHRLTAITLSGITLKEVLVVEVNDDQVSSYIDTNVRPRTLNDIRKFNGLRTVNNAVIAAILLDYTNFKHHDRMVLTKAEQSLIVEGSPHIDDLTALYSAGRSKLGLTSSQLAGFLRCIKANRNAAMAFFTAACQNNHEVAGIYEPNVKLLIDWMFRSRERRIGKIRGSTATYSQEAVTSASKVIKAYNAWRRGEVLLKLQQSDNMPEAEK